MNLQQGLKALIVVLLIFLCTGIYLGLNSHSSEGGENNAPPDRFEEKKELSHKEKQVNQPANEENNEITIDKDLNSYVLELLETYENTPYLLNNDYDNYNGVTTTLTYKNKVLAKAHPSGNKASHCVGLTFEVFFKALQQRNKDLGLELNDFNGMTWEQLYDFLLTWYVASGDKTTNNIEIAVEKYGIGKSIDKFSEAKPGDFIDFSRENNTGHTAVFINWIRKNDNIIGFRYWSTQQSTNGISYNEEYFNVLDEDSNKYGNVMINHVYLARISPINEYQKLN
ncbi:MAG: hypothetical protein FH758_10540 [Firmicutes bacterium]|nr:hypothetical protein [Bacillota bacterium]